MTKLETARNLALKVLEDVFVNQAYSNIALNKHLKGSQLSVADKGLVTELVYGTVARKLTLEWYLSHFIEDRDKLDSWLYVLLLMSVYQLQYLDKLPDHAVVNEAVELAKLRKRVAKNWSMQSFAVSCVRACQILPLSSVRTSVILSPTLCQCG